MKRFKYYLSCFTRSSVINEYDKYFSVLSENFPSVLPAKIHKNENKKVDFDLARKQHLSDWWNSGSVFWTGANGLYGWAILGMAKRHTHILHTFRSALNCDEELVTLAEQLAINLDCDYVFVHPIPDVESEMTPGQKNMGSATARLLPKGLPGMAWLTCLGKPYEELIGEQFLNNIADVETKKIANGSLLLKLADSHGALDESEKFNELRSRVCSSLPATAFYDSARVDDSLSVPRFKEPIVVRIN